MANILDKLNKHAQSNPSEGPAMLNKKTTDAASLYWGMDEGVT